jgi:hypothetical protein
MLVASPGMFIRIDVIEPPVELIAVIAIRRERPETLSRPKVKGRRRAMAVKPPIAGRIPMKIPMQIPRTKNPSATGSA